MSAPQRPHDPLLRELEQVRAESGPAVPQPSVTRLVGRRLFWLLGTLELMLLAFYAIWKLALQP
jgi:hypothetical protein